MTWNESNPALANQVANDIPDIWENFDEIRDVADALLHGTLGTTAAASYAYIMNGFFDRPLFTYNGGSAAYTVKATAASYMCKDKFCHWVSEITTDAVGAPSADTWYYLYIDYSAITSGTAVTNSELIWSDTAPTFNTTYRQWMNGDDRCIFAVLTNGTPDDIVEFFHDGGDRVWYADSITDRSAADLDTTFTDVPLTIPAFTEKATVTGYIGGAASANQVYMSWRTDGQTGTTGHILMAASEGGVGRLGAGQGVVHASSQIIEIKLSAAGSETAALYTDAWHFPRGM